MIFKVIFRSCGVRQATSDNIYWLQDATLVELKLDQNIRQPHHVFSVLKCLVMLV